jgi:hypothetical protein
MRPLILISVLAWAGCAAESDPRPPPSNRFVYPSGIAHRQVSGSSNGALYVASANFDKCFDTGAVLALDLDALGLPPLGAPPDPAGPAEITELQVTAEGYVQIDSFAGQMALWPGRGEQAPRLLVPTRTESNALHGVDILGPTTLGCAWNEGRNCLSGGLSLTSNIAGAEDDLPRAPAPIGVSVVEVEERAEAWVTHIEAADSPARTGNNFQTYVVQIPDISGGQQRLNAGNFIRLESSGLGGGGTHGAAIGQQYVYVTGRTYVEGPTPRQATFLLRLIDRRAPQRILETNLHLVYQTQEAREVVLSSYDPDRDAERLYILARAPDSLLVVDVLGASTLRPQVSLVDSVLLPDGASSVRILPRGGPGDDLVAVSCTASILTRGVVVLYDAKLGQIVAQVDDVGRQPYGLAVDQRGTAARLYVTNFGDGRVAVIDIPNLVEPQNAYLVAYLGRLQGRDEKQGTSTCQQESEP